jgi:hypothetical protein
MELDEVGVSSVGLEKNKHWISYRIMLVVRMKIQILHLLLENEEKNGKTVEKRKSI